MPMSCVPCAPPHLSVPPCRDANPLELENADFHSEVQLLAKRRCLEFGKCWWECPHSSGYNPDKATCCARCSSGPVYLLQVEELWGRLWGLRRSKSIAPIPCLSSWEGYAVGFVAHLSLFCPRASRDTVWDPRLPGWWIVSTVSSHLGKVVLLKCRFLRLIIVYKFLDSSKKGSCFSPRQPSRKEQGLFLVLLLTGIKKRAWPLESHWPGFEFHHWLSTKLLPPVLVFSIW